MKESERARGQQHNSKVAVEWVAGDTVKKKKRTVRCELVGGGGLGVTLMEYHSTFEWWEADNQRDVAAEFRGPRAKHA